MLRFTLRYPAIDAQSAPTTTPVIIMSGTSRNAGKLVAPPTTAAIKIARRYWPSIPMLKRSIRKPIAAATPAR